MSKAKPLTADTRQIAATLEHIAAQVKRWSPADDPHGLALSGALVRLEAQVRQLKASIKKQRKAAKCAAPFS